MVQTKNTQRSNRNSWPEGMAFDTGNRHAPAAATAAVVTIAADAARPIFLSQIWCSYSATPTGGSLKVENGAGTVVWGPHHIPAAGPQQFDFMPPLCGSKNTALIVTLASGAGSVEGVLTVNAWKEE